MLSPREYGRWAPSEDGVTLTWSELSIYVRKPSKSFFGLNSPAYKRIINNVTGVIEPGQLVAMLGASGAGKSTLMSCLANRIPGDMLVDGDIRVNGRKIGDYMQRLSGFMHQEDLFVSSLTVSEHLYLMARLKLDRRVTRARREQIINNLINELNLSSCANTRIGGSGSDKEKLYISGGERKRVAFATECLTNPKLLFCDEPTTGLDSSSAHYLIKMLQEMTVVQRRTVLCTIHQPSSEIFELFHRIILVANGRIAFIGPTETALEFFKSQGYECPLSYNPADYLIRTLAQTPGSENSAKQAVKRICDQFAVSDHAREIEMKVQFELHMASTYEDVADLNINSHKQPLWPTTLYWLCYRLILDITRDPQVQTLRIIQKIALALIIGLCFIGTLNLDQKGVQAIQGALFMLVTENTFSPMYAVLNYFPTQLPLFIREFQNGICSPSQFYLANLLSMIPGLIIEPTLFVGLMYWISGLKTTMEAFLLSVLVVILCINVSSSCGVFFSTAFESVPVAMAYLIPFDYCLMITSGLFINLSTLPQYISWVQNLSWMMYANEALNIVQWDQVHNITCETYRADIPCLDNGLDVLQRSSFSPNNFVKDIVSMVVLYLIFHVLGFICLYIRIRGKKPVL